MSKKPTYAELEQQILELKSLESERKWAEEALRQSEDRMMALSEASFEAIFLSEKGICVDQNQTAEMMFGFTHAEAIGKPGIEWIVPEDHDLVKKNMQLGHEKPYEVTALRKDGTTFPCEIQGRMTIYQTRPRRITSLRDITELKEEQAVLRESEALYHSAISTLSEGLVIHDQSGKIIFANQTAANILGLSMDQLKSKDSYDPLWQALGQDGTPFQPEDHPSLISMRTGEPVDNTIMNIHAGDGKRRVLSVNSRPILNDSSEVVQVVVTFTDKTERIQAEDKIKASEGMLSKAEIIAHMGTWQLNPSTNKVRGSDGIYQIFGIPREESDSLLEKVNSMIHPDDRERAIQISQTSIAEKKAYNIEFRINHPSGEIRHVKTRGEVVCDDKGEILEVIGSVQDITERKQANEALRLTQFTVDNSTDAIYWMGPDAKFIYVNNASTKALGYSRKELLTMTVHDIGPDFPVEVWSAHWAELKKRKSFIIHTTHQRKNKSSFPVEITVYYIQFGDKELNCAIAKDITERKQAEEALRTSRNRATALLSAIPDLMFRLNDEGVFLDYKADENALYVTDPKSIIGRRNRDILPPSISNLVDEKISETFESGEMQTFEYNLTMPENDLRDYEARMVKSGEDEVIAIVRDISKRKHLEEQLRESQRLEALGTMVGGVAHEFNNALQSLFLYAGLVKDQLPEEQTVKDDFERLIGSANDAKHIVEQVMLISSQDSGHPEQIVLADLISDVVNLKIGSRLSVQNVDLTLAEDCPPLVADKQQIQTVLEQVIDNAILAIANGGDLSVSLECNEHTTEKSTRSWRVQLTITDTGMGMTEETLSQAFNPFFSTREVGQGKGFGLSIVYNILQNMGASISATSRFGEGSSFVIEFPSGKIPDQ